MRIKNLAISKKLSVCGFWLLAALLSPVYSFSQTKPAAEIVKESPGIIANLDSLVNLWYLKNTAPARARRSMNVYGFKPDYVPSYSDSVYVERISKMAKESGLPYTYNPMVKAFIELYAVRKRDLVEKMLGLSDYYFPISEDAFIRYDIPIEIKYLSVVESALNAEAVSKANAVGLWQFMYPTGRLYRLNVSNYVDERKDPYKSTDAAAQYLKDLYNTFGDWFLALAAYNCGPGNINKAIRRSGGKKTYWEVYNYLPLETRGYVPAFIAASYVFAYHKEHNLYPQTINLPSLVDTVYVDKELDFTTICRTLNVQDAVLKNLNPQFKKYRIPADEAHKFELRLPSAKASLFVQIKDSVYTCQRNMNMPVKKVYATAAESTAAAHNDSIRSGQAPPPPANNQNTQKVWISYTVKSRDKLSELSTLFNVGANYLVQWNGLRSTNLVPGRKLLVYVPAEKANYYRKINIATSAQKRRLLGYPAEEVKPKQAIVQKPQPQQPEGKLQYYVVQKGDTIWSIAQRFPGVSVDDIKRLNNLTEQSIKVGQKIKIQTKA
jgi:membrane-bound lytic murein transglycosylase D